MKKYLIVPISTLSLTIVSCGKVGQPSPPVIVEKDYFTANIDGNFFKGGCNGAFNNCLTARYDSTSNYFYLRGSNGSQTIDINLRDSTTLNYISGTFELSGSRVSSTGYYGNVALYLDYQPGTLYHYATDSEHKGIITVHIDKIKKRATGTFSFKVKNTDGAAKEIEVTSGKFSLTIN